MEERKGEKRRKNFRKKGRTIERKEEGREERKNASPPASSVPPAMAKLPTVCLFLSNSPTSLLTPVNSLLVAAADSEAAPAPLPPVSGETGATSTGERWSPDAVADDVRTPLLPPSIRGRLFPVVEDIVESSF